MLCRLVLAWLATSAFALAASAADVTVEKTDRGAAVKVNGQPFTEYLTRSGSKPILWPVIGPTGARMTRNWPMEEGVTGEADHDHVHQRSLWFTHGSVNGIDFWSEGKGIIEQREVVKLESGPPAVIVTRNDWLSPDGSKLILQDERAMTFGADADSRWIDFDITLKATAGPVVFGDTKEGSFGARVASSMRVAVEAGWQDRQQRRPNQRCRLGQARRVGRLPRTRRSSRRRQPRRRPRDSQSSHQLPLPHVLARANLRAVRRQPLRPEGLYGRPREGRIHAARRREPAAALSGAAAQRRRKVGPSGGSIRHVRQLTVRPGCFRRDLQAAAPLRHGESGEHLCVHGRAGTSCWVVVNPLICQNCHSCCKCHSPFYR